MGGLDHDFVDRRLRVSTLAVRTYPERRPYPVKRLDSMAGLACSSCYVRCKVRAKHPKFDQRVTLRMVSGAHPRYRSGALSNKTGIRINVAQGASLLTATVLVHDQPLDQVIDTLAGVLELQYTKGDRSFSLTLDQVVQAYRNRYSRAEDDLLFRGIRRALDALSYAIAHPAEVADSAEEGEGEPFGRMRSCAIRPSWRDGPRRIPGS